MGHLLTRRWPAVAIAAVLFAALWSLLIPGPVFAEDSSDAPETGPTVSQMIPAGPVDPAAPEPEAPPIEVPPEPEPPAMPEDPAPAPPVEVPVIEAPIEQISVPPEPVAPAPEAPPAPESVEAPAPTGEPTPEPEVTKPPATQKAAPVPANADQKLVVKRTDVTNAAAQDGMPEGSPLVVQLLTIAVLLALGFGYFRLMGRSSRPVPSTKKSERETGV